MIALLLSAVCMGPIQVSSEWTVDQPPTAIINSLISRPGSRFQLPAELADLVELGDVEVDTHWRLKDHHFTERANLIAPPDVFLLRRLNVLTQTLDVQGTKTTTTFRATLTVGWGWDGWLIRRKLSRLASEAVAKQREQLRTLTEAKP